MAKTVMQALIERIRAEKNILNKRTIKEDFEDGLLIAYDNILAHAEEMIKQEREQIEEAYDSGRYAQDFRNGIYHENREDYYNKTFGEI